jgi:hypothetical protein
MPTFNFPAWYISGVLQPAQTIVINKFENVEWNNSFCSVGLDENKKTETNFWVGKSGKAFGVALQKALDYCESFNGGTIFLTNRNSYFLEASTSILVPNNTKIVGLGQNYTRIIKDVNCDSTFLFYQPAFTGKAGTAGFKAIHFEGFTFSGQLPAGWTVNQQNGCCFFAYSKGSSKSNFIDLSFDHLDSSALGFEPVFSSSGENGITYNYSDIYCERIYTDCASCGSGIAFGGPGAQNCNVINSSVQARDSAIAYFSPQANCYVINNTINGFQSNTGAGVELSLTQTCVGGYLNILNNKIKNYNGNGVFFNDYQNNKNYYNQLCQVAFNDISNCKIISNGGGGNGIYNNGGRNISVHHNRVYNCEKNGIIQTASLAKEGRNNNYYYNEVFNNSTSSSGGYANFAFTIESEGKLFDNIVKYNNLYDNNYNKFVRNGMSFGVIGGYPASSYFARNIAQTNLQRVNQNSTTWFNSTVRPPSEIQTSNTIQT